MAKKPPPRVAAQPQKKQGGVNKIVVLMIVAALVPFSLPTAIIVAPCLFPTLGAYFSERGNNRYAWLCVGGLNFSGVVPTLFGLWFGVHTMDEALRLLSDATVLFWSYATAAIGWGIYKAMPPLVANWMSFSTERRVAGLKAAQRKLVDDWGDDVRKKG